jgi:crossover junction endodeoxyribonuclease RuvC
MSRTSRLDELTERARRTLARSAPHETPRPVSPVAPVEGMPPLPPLPSMPVAPPIPVERVPGGGAGQIVLGIDPGTATMGYGVVAVASGAGEGLGAYAPVAYGVLTTHPSETMERRLLKLHEGLVDLIRTHRPHHVAVEQLFFGRNVTTAVTVGQARGVALLAAAEFGLAISEYKPAEIKYTVAGFGKADKAQMQRMVQSLLSLESIPKPDDAADALAIAICHLRHARVRALGL